MVSRRSMTQRQAPTAESCRFGEPFCDAGQDALSPGGVDAEVAVASARARIERKSARPRHQRQDRHVNIVHKPQQARGRGEHESPGGAVAHDEFRPGIGQNAPCITPASAPAEEAKTGAITVGAALRHTPSGAMSHQVGRRGGTSVSKSTIALHRAPDKRLGQGSQKQKGPTAGAIGPFVRNGAFASREAA